MELVNNKVKKSEAKKALKNQKKQIKKFGDDRKESFAIKVKDSKYLGKNLGIKEIKIIKGDKPLDKIDIKKGIAIGTIKMGFGHYRIGMAFASWIHAYGYTPYWIDMFAAEGTATEKIIKNTEKLYAKGSRWSANSKLFNKYVWEKVTYTGFRNLGFAAQQEKVAEIFSGIFSGIDKKIPFIATHGWAAQAGSYYFDSVHQAIPDNFALGLYLANNIKSYTQTVSLYTNYLTLNNFSKKRLNFMDEGQMFYAGHFIDKELVDNIESDCKARIQRSKKKLKKRILFSIGGSGAQSEYILKFLPKLIDLVKKDKISLWINVGNHMKAYEILKKAKGFNELVKEHMTYNGQKAFAEKALKDNTIGGIHIFFNKDTTPAVYITNLLMRAADVLATKPSELAFYPVPKMHIKHVGKHETHGGLHAEEIGDALFEVEEPKDVEMAIDAFLETNILEVISTEIIRNKSAGKYDGAKNIVQQIIKNMERKK